MEFSLLLFRFQGTFTLCRRGFSLGVFQFVGIMPRFYSLYKVYTSDVTVVALASIGLVAQIFSLYEPCTPVFSVFGLASAWHLCPVCTSPRTGSFEHLLGSLDTR